MWIYDCYFKIPYCFDKILYQISGTCWLNSILNYILANNVLRKIIKDKIIDKYFKNKNININDYNIEIIINISENKYKLYNFFTAFKNYTDDEKDKIIKSYIDNLFIHLKC